MTDATDFGYIHYYPGQYVAADGAKVTIPGVADDAGSRDTSATTPAGAQANALERMRELEADTLTPTIGDPVPLPPV
jgi:hypothetical protein